MTLTKKVFFVVAALYWLLGMHVFMHNPGGDGFYLPFNMLGWAFASVLIGIGLWHVTVTQQLVFSRSQLWFWGGLAVACLPFLAHPEVSIDAGVPRMLGIAGGCLLLFSLSQLQLTRQERYLLLYMLLAGVAIEALFGLVQYFLLTPTNWIGYNTSINRPYGIFQKDSVLSSFLAMGISLALFLHFYAINKLSSWKHILTGGLVFVSSILLVLIQSRAGQIGALIAVFLLCISALKTQPKRVTTMIVLMLFGLAVGVFVSSGVGGRSPENYGLTIDYRLLYWRHSLDLLFRAPWVGYGYGMFESIFVNSYYVIPQSISGVPIIEPNLSHPHNEILYWAVEGGMVAVFGLALMAWGWWRILAPHAWGKRLALFALPFPLFFHAMVEYPFYHSTAHWLALIWLVWFTDAEAEAETVIPLSNWLLLRALAVLIPLLTVPYMLTGLHTAYLVTQFERGGLKDPSLLNRVVNPLPWYTRFMYDVSSVHLINGLATKDEAQQREDLSTYISWASELVKLSPRANVYYNAALALDAIGRHEEAEQWRQTGARLFPADPIFKQVPSAASGALAPSEQRVGAAHK